MNKTITITLAGQLFHVEEDAYQKLDEYLKSIKYYFSTYPDSGEIVSDIESRIAELFLGKGNRDRIITSADVEELMESMGRVEDFGYEGEGSKQAPPPPPAGTPKKLLRNPDDQVIAGVCSGIAAYFGWDPVIVRVVFGITIFFGGGGILLYLLLWLAMPEAKTTSDKIQMRGAALTLQSFKETIKERAEDVRAAQGPVKNFLSDLFSAIGKVIKVLTMVIAKIIGVAVVIGSVVGIIALTFTLLVVLFNINSPYVDFPVRQVFSGLPYFIGLFAGYFALLIPAILLIIAASFILTPRKHMNRVAIAVLAVFWLASLVTGGALATRYAPEAVERYNALPENQTVSKEYPGLTGFSKIDVSGANKVIAKPGNEYKVTAHGKQRDLDRVKISEKDGTLSVGWENNRVCIFCINETVTVEVTMPTFNAVSASGASRVEAKGFAPLAFNTELSGASRAILDINTAELTANLSGASRVEASGTATSLLVRESGASRFDGTALKSKISTFELSGSSRAYTDTAEEITVKASGASKLYFQGNPRIKQNLSGSSRIINENSTSEEEPDFYPEQPQPVTQ